MIIHIHYTAIQYNVCIYYLLYIYGTFGGYIFEQIIINSRARAKGHWDNI